MTQAYPIKINKLEEYVHIFWDSYVHIFEVREANFKNSIHYLLIIVSFSPIVSLTFYAEFKWMFFFLPMLMQALALIILLKSFFIKSSIPWFELEKTLSELDNDSFVVEIIAKLKAFENLSYVCMLEYRNIIKSSLLLLIVSIILLMYECFFKILGKSEFYFTMILLPIIILLLYGYYKKIPEIDYKEDVEKYRRKLEEFLSNNSGSQIGC